MWEVDPETKTKVRLSLSIWSSQAGYLRLYGFFN
jgi:hypothetical protein